MRKILLALLFACGGGSKPPPQQPIANVAPPAAEPQKPAPPPDPMSEAMAAMRHFSDNMCLCRDQACAQKVSDDMVKWAQEAGKDQRLNRIKPTEEQTKELVAITQRMTECMTKAMGAGGQPQQQPPPPPPPPPPPH